MCVYGMEGPGGYQLVGRTIQVWNTWKSTAAFAEGIPWSLRFFDQIRFYPVTAEELLDARERFPHGGYELKVEETTFNLAEYQSFLNSINVEAAEFKRHQKASFDAERERWRAAGLLAVVEPPDMPDENVNATVPDGCEGVSSPVSASIFQIAVKKGQSVAEGEKLIVLDAMKTEIVVASHVAGEVEDIYCDLGALVNGGQLVVAIRPS
jgi:urea carboxylase